MFTVLSGLISQMQLCMLTIRNRSTLFKLYLKAILSSPLQMQSYIRPAKLQHTEGTEIL